MMKNKQGFILMSTYFVIALLLILGTGIFARSVSESRIAIHNRYSTQAFHVAEAGIERVMLDLRNDFDNDPVTPSFRDGDINGMACGPDTVNFYPVPYVSTSLGEGSYIVRLKNIVDKDGEIWVSSTGTVNEHQRTIEVYIKMVDISPWNNAIFAGSGIVGEVISGNVDVRGSVHILGTGLNDTDFAIDMSGGALIGNNYEGMDQALEDRIPACPTTMFNSENVESLKAKLRVKNGLVGLNGGATVGEPDVPANAYKETVDGTFNTDGYGGEKGEENVYSDNGTRKRYDLGNRVDFPGLGDPYGGYATYQEYLRDNALVITDAAQLSELADITPQSSFDYVDAGGKGSISMDGSGNLAISGIVYIDGGDLNFRKQGPRKSIYYTGKGSLLVTGNVEVAANLYTQGDSSFPTNIMGIMTPNQINFNAAQLDVMGLFYAEDTITSEKQTDVTGTFLSNFLDMGTNVPSVFQVILGVESLPPGLIGSEPIWLATVVSWQEL